MWIDLSSNYLWLFVDDILLTTIWSKILLSCAFIVCIHQDLHNAVCLLFVFQELCLADQLICRYTV